MRRWGWVLGLGLTGCLQTPDVQLADPDQAVADARPDARPDLRPDEGPTPDMELKDAAPPRPDQAPDAGCQPEPERCDGLDDDCDGIADEGLGLGDDCVVGMGECQRGGVLVCAAGGEVGCSATAGAPADEACNGRDDDCDGAADEAIPTTPCTPRDCAEGVMVCEFGASLCVPPPGLEEDCATAGDDDCDGVVDEGCACPPDAERACGSDEGRCEAGVQACTGEGWGPCAGAVAPREERCDGVDDDCDGRTDEGLGGMACEADAAVGACRAGTSACEDGSPRCLQGAPGAETCDGTDEDCDGRVDEDFQVGEACTAGRGLCLRNGRRVCDGPAASRCSASPGPERPEACNRGDDDCDGRVDEGFAVGEACVRGEGACQSAGVQVCAPDGAGVACNAPEPGAGAPEQCDGLDNDCDDQVDEAAAVGACRVGVGACRRSGDVTCEGGERGCSATPGRPGPETCDGVDNDCDGTVDEGLDEAPCVVDGAQGLCRDGLTRCERGTLDCVARSPRPEACDGLDNDCDGQVDNEVPEAGCDSGEPGRCAQGVTACVDGVVSCEPLLGPRPEVCDGADNDCDDSVDEGPPLLLCSRALPNASQRCVEGACVATCEEGFIDLDGAPGCERGCAFDGGIGIGLFPGATDVHAATDPENNLAALVMVPTGAKFTRLGGPVVDLDVVGAESGALLSPAPDRWVAAISFTQANGAVEDGVEVFLLDGGEAPLATRQLVTGPQATGLLGFTERDGGGDGAVFVMGLTGGNNLFHYRATEDVLPPLAARTSYPGLNPLSHLALAPVDGRGWLFGWDNRDDRLHTVLADGQGVANPTESPHVRLDAVRGGALATEAGVLLMTGDRNGTLSMTRFDPQARTYSFPVQPVLPRLSRFTVFAGLETQPFVLSGSDRGVCQLWPVGANMAVGGAIPVPAPGCDVTAVVRGSERGVVGMLLLSANGDLSLLSATCQ